MLLSGRTLHRGRSSEWRRQLGCGRGASRGVVSSQGSLLVAFRQYELFMLMAVCCMTCGCLLLKTQPAAVSDLHSGASCRENETTILGRSAVHGPCPVRRSGRHWLSHAERCPAACSRPAQQDSGDCRRSAALSWSSFLFWFPRQSRESSGIDLSVLWLSRTGAAQSWTDDRWEVGRSAYLQRERGGRDAAHGRDEKCTHNFYGTLWRWRCDERFSTSPPFGRLNLKQRKRWSPFSLLLSLVRLRVYITWVWKHVTSNSWRCLPCIVLCILTTRVTVILTHSEQFSGHSWRSLYKRWNVSYFHVLLSQGILMSFCIQRNIPEVCYVSTHLLPNHSLWPKSRWSLQQTFPNEVACFSVSLFVTSWWNSPPVAPQCSRQTDRHVVTLWTELPDFRQASVNMVTTLGPITHGKFIDQLSHYQLLKKDSAPWSCLQPCSLQYH
jgi:hypothetical protein